MLMARISGTGATRLWFSVVRWRSSDLPATGVVILRKNQNRGTVQALGPDDRGRPADVPLRAETQDEIGHLDRPYRRHAEATVDRLEAEARINNETR